MNYRTLLMVFLVLVLTASATFTASTRASSSVQSLAPAPDSALLDQLVKATDGHVRISRHAATGQVRFVGTDSNHAVPRSVSLHANATPEQAARAFLGQYGALFGLQDPSRELTLMQESASLAGGTAVRFQQTYHGVPVLAGEVTVQLDAQLNTLSAGGEVLSGLNVVTTPRIDAASATDQARSAVAKYYGVDATDLRVSAPELWLYAPELIGPGPRTHSLVWRMEVRTGTPPVRELVLINAQRGTIDLHFNQIADAKVRHVCDAQGQLDTDADPDNDCTPADYVRNEGQGPTGNSDVDLAYDYSGVVYDYFATNFGRDSIDGAGMPLISLVRYCPNDSSQCPFQNAFWDGVQMTYGTSFASSDDVVAHELSHGVTEHSSHLLYYYQSGALNESMSDVFGEYADLTDGVGTDTPDVRWLMGEDLPASIGAIRNMQDPTAFNDPDKMSSSNYYLDSDDNGGVHTNSGVNNKTAYLIADGGSFNGQTISGLGLIKAGKIYYEVETTLLTSGSDYQDMFDYLPQACTNLVGTAGITAGDCAQVKKAVLATEMNQEASNAPEAPVCAAGQTPQNVFFDDFENPASGKWAASAVTGTEVAWYYPQNSHPYAGYDATYATSGKYNLWGDNADHTTDSAIAMTQEVVVPANAYLHFRHAFAFESLLGIFGYDGGVVEYSVNNGALWQDAGPLMSDVGYNGSIESSFGNPLGGRDAFVAISGGYISTRLNLSSLAGQSARFRFRIGTDSGSGERGWFIDDLRIYTCGSPAATRSITTMLGSGQFAKINTAFATPLQVKVVDGASQPINGASVTFTAPASGASGRFAGNTASVTVQTNANGIATAPAFTANGTAGSYTVQATTANASVPAVFTLTNTTGAVENLYLPMVRR